MQKKRLLPISVQSFEVLRNANCVYVDKTEYVYRLVHDVAQFFLSRPRRFGKSLLLSTLKAYWEGKKELFSGLAIEKLEADNADAWQPYPVFYFDFNGENYDITPVEDVIVKHLKRWEKIYGITDTSVTLGDRFQTVLITASEKTGKRCIVLVDEYDKPLLDL
ncbi:MAG: AAA family ATPase, partial [Ruminococcus sp.]|nr:AAA family ATPase [Ruminococcus sp.]